jgi:hypothetical protein
MWPVVLFNLVLSLVLCGLLVWRVRRYSRRADEIEASLVAERDAAIADLKAQTDAAVAGFRRGSFVTRKVTGPPVVVDCSDWGRPEASRLELIVDVPDDVDDKTVRKFTRRVVRLIADIDPELRLTYDADRTRAEAGVVRVVLTPRTPVADAGKRIADVIALVNGRLADGLKDAPKFQLCEAA